MRRYGEVTQRVLLLTGDADWLIPSREEGPRLEKALPRCNLRVRKIFNILAHANFNTENQIWVCQEGAASGEGGARRRRHLQCQDALSVLVYLEQAQHKNKRRKYTAKKRPRLEKALPRCT